MMLNYISRRFASAAAVIFAVSLITFAVLMIIPSNAAQLMLGTDADAQTLLALEQAMGLDKPWYEQYLRWLMNLMRLDLGESYLFGEKVSSLIMQRLSVTFSLAVFSILIATVVSVLLGVFSAINQNGILDFLTRSIMQLASALPSFWLGMIFILYFGLELRILPISGYVGISEGFFEYIKSILMPSVVLAIGETGVLLRTVRTSVIESLNNDYMDMARVRGLKSSAIYFKYALRGAIVAPINVIGIQFAKLIGGTIVVESVFALPGIGRLLLVAVEQRDIILLQGLVMFITAGVVLISFLVDIAVMLANPKIRLGGRGE